MNRKYQAVYQYPEKTHGPEGKYGYVTVGDALLDLPQIEKGEQSNEYIFDIQSVKEEQRKLFLEQMHGDMASVPEHIGYHYHSLYNHKAPGHTKKMLERIKSIRQGENMQKAYERLVKEGREEFAKENFPNKLYAARNRRLMPTEPSFTVTSHCLDEMIHPTLHRGLTPREVARLQSFPDWISLKDLM